LKCPHWPKGMSILIKILGHEKNVTFDQYIWQKWPFRPKVKSKIWSKWTNVHQNAMA
jgi:hypothetical protein